MKVGQHVRFIRKTDPSNIYNYTPDKVYPVVEQLAGAEVFVGPRDNDGAVPRDTKGLMFDIVE